MRKKTIVTLYILSVTLEIVGGIAAFHAVTANTSPFISCSASTCSATLLQTSIVAVSIGLMVIACVLSLISWIGALIKQGRQEQWAWFVCTLLFGGICLLIYLIAIPETPEYPMQSYYDNHVPLPPYPSSPYPPPAVPERKRTSLFIWLIIPLLIGAIGVIAAIVIPAFIVYGPHSSSNNAGQSGSVSLSSTNGSVNSSYQPVDGITCDSSEQLAYHIHAHLSIYINGQSIAIPQSIGIASDQSCYYWLHTHDTSGVIHVEVPSNQNYTLGDFLDIWKLRFADLGTGFPSQLSQSGWTILVNGQSSHNNLHTIQLSSHELITLAYNSPGIQPDTTYNWGEL